MPKLDNREITKVDLPGFPKDDPAWVKMRKEPSANGLMQVEEAKLTNPNIGNTRIGFLLLADLIQEWNLTDAHGDLAQITPENVGTLPMKALVKLQEDVDFDEVKSLSKAKKKP